jgi:hypothetical protein
MISLDAPKEPFELPLLEGISFTVMPMEAVDLQVARIRAQQTVDKILSALEALAETDVYLPEGFDPAKPEYQAALRQNMTIQYLGVSQIKGWSGVLDQEDQPLPCREDIIRWVLRDPLIADKFFDGVTEWHRKRLAAKKESGTASNGQAEAVSITATPAELKNPPAPADCPSTASAARWWKTLPRLFRKTRR